MTYLICVFAMALAAMLLAPEAGISRWLKRTIVEVPSEWLARRKRGQIALWVMLGLFIALCVWAPEVARGFAALFAGSADGVPLIMALLDGSVVLEILMAVWLAAASLKTLWRLAKRAADACVAPVRRMLQTARRGQVRSRRGRRDTATKKPDDSSPEPGFVFA